jgi:hypothetical protein
LALAYGYKRIVGELAGVGVGVSATTVAKILRQSGVSPAGGRAQLGWRAFLRAHADSIIACDFFAVETLWLGRLYVLFFLELSSRRVHFAGCSANPDGGWTTQQARQLACSLRASDTGTLSDPRPRLQIHPCLRRGFPQRGRPDHPHSVSRAAGKRARRTLDRQRPP